MEGFWFGILMIPVIVGWLLAVGWLLRKVGFFRP
jgi:uncharacterized membrane protein